MGPLDGKQPIRTRYLGLVTGYQPIRDQYFLIRSVAALDGMIAVTWIYSFLFTRTIYCSSECLRSDGNNIILADI